MQIPQSNIDAHNAPVSPSLRLQGAPSAPHSSSTAPGVDSVLDASETRVYAQPSAQATVALMPEDTVLNSEQQLQKKQLEKQFPDLVNTIHALAQGSAPVLLKKDAQGQTVLSQLHQLCQSKGFCPEVSTQGVARQLILRLNDRSEIFQGPQYTCGSAALQNYMTSNDPGEMVHIVKSLATSGKAKLRDGSMLKLPEDTQAYLKSQSSYRFNEGKDKDTRTVSDILFQSAVMKDISIVGGDRAWKGESQSLLDGGVKALAWLTDWADYNAKNDDVGLLPKLAGNGGGDPLLLEQLTEAMTGHSMTRESVLNPENSWGNQNAFKKVLSSIKRGENEVLTLLKSPLHYVLLTDYDVKQQTVTYLSTGTYARDTGQKSVTAYQTLSVADFLANCGALIYPEK